MIKTQKNWQSSLARQQRRLAAAEWRRSSLPDRAGARGKQRDAGACVFWGVKHQARVSSSIIHHHQVATPQNGGFSSQRACALVGVAERKKQIGQVAASLAQPARANESTS
jgi:hypothetical protein